MCRRIVIIYKDIHIRYLLVIFRLASFVLWVCVFCCDCDQNSKAAECCKLGYVHVGLSTNTINRNLCGIFFLCVCANFSYAIFSVNWTEFNVHTLISTMLFFSFYIMRCFFSLLVLFHFNALFFFFVHSAFRLELLARLYSESPFFFMSCLFFLKFSFWLHIRTHIPIKWKHFVPSMKLWKLPE